MKTAFKISPEVDNYFLTNLLIEVGNDEIAFLIYSAKPFVLHGLYQYYVDKNSNQNAISDGIKLFVKEEPILQEKFEAVNIFYNSNENCLVPTNLFKESEKENTIALLYGTNQAAYTFHEDVQHREIKMVYRVSQLMYDTLNELFAKNTFAHSTSYQLLPDKNIGNVLECIVYQHKIKVILCKQSELQIVQFFNYEIPIDVCYFLLNICHQFDVALPSVQLLLSGMIDEFSNLYAELYKYFLNISFVQIPVGIEVDRKLRKQPHHYYSHLSALAQCV